jgi:hypothetical protein
MEVIPRKKWLKVGVFRFFAIDQGRVALGKAISCRDWISGSVLGPVPSLERGGSGLSPGGLRTI